MKKTEPKRQVALLICTFLISITGLNGLRAQDQVTLTNPSTYEIGLLVDGKLNGSYANDATYVSAGSPALIGQFSMIGGSRPNEIMAFTQDRPMAISSAVPWTPGNDNFTVPFADKVLIPITIWIVYSDTDFATASAKAANDALTTSTVYGKERVGIDFSSVTINDATQNPLASKYYDYEKGTMEGPIKTDIGYVTGQINVYYVRSLNWSGILRTNAGEADRIGGPSVISGSGTNNTVLSHEMGHLFALWHVHTGVPTQWFDNSNVMSTNGSLKAQYLTEGQVLRMHLTSSSVLNETYHARPGQLIRDCDGTSLKTTATCPGVQKRIWADGTYLAN